jgi:hypothetical protein
MTVERPHPPSNPQLTTRQPRAARALALIPVLALALALAPALAAAKHPKLAQPVQPSSTGAAKTARQALVKQRTLTVPRTVPKPGKIVGGSTTRPPKTIVTKRFLPK